MRNIILILSVLMGMNSYAHQSNLSTVVFSQTDDGKYVLQITSSLAAFEGEIDLQYTKDAYKTPEEFKKLVVAHFLENFTFNINGDDALQLMHPIVILGHETKLVAEVVGIPKEVHSLYLQSQMFQNVHHNKSSVIMIVDGFPKKQYLLNKENKHTIDLEIVNGTWEAAVEKPSDFIRKNLPYILLLGIPLAYFIVTFTVRRLQ
ncbi:hypothetical protein Q4595_13815 [Wenyingzhuangia sp. 1_MG-2023]|nr:hypothetical protein [Wenyingzhuangia sp. 1_MG-2023]